MSVKVTIETPDYPDLHTAKKRSDTLFEHVVVPHLLECYQFPATRWRWARPDEDMWAKIDVHCLVYGEWQSMQYRRQEADFASFGTFTVRQSEWVQWDNVLTGQSHLPVPDWFLMAYTDNLRVHLMGLIPTRLLLSAHYDADTRAVLGLPTLPRPAPYFFRSASNNPFTAVPIADLADDADGAFQWCSHI